MSEQFSLDLLQAISDWQQGGNFELKKKYGIQLKSTATSLDPEFRQCDVVCYRRISLGKSPLWKLIAEQELPETISSWTNDVSIAKAFKGGVQEEGWQGIIAQHKPTPDEVIVNLDYLYADRDFQSAVEKHKHNIENFDLGIGLYGNHEREIVIEKTSLAPSEIYALGGYSSSPNVIGHKIFGREPTPKEITFMEKRLAQRDEKFGAWWLTGDPLQRVLKKVESHIPALKKKKTKRYSENVRANPRNWITPS